MIAAKQVAAHLYFLISGFLWTIRLKLERIHLLKASDPMVARERATNYYRHYLELCRRWGFLKTEFIGFERAHEWQGSVLAPNHPSIFDGLFLMTLLPHLDCVLSTKLLENPFTAGAAILCDHVHNDKPFRMIRNCEERLAAGSNILIFPEGSRTATPPVGPFHQLYALAAIRARAPIRTVLIECDSDSLGRKFSIFRPSSCAIPITFRVTAGRVFECPAGTNPRELSSKIEAYFHAQLAKNAIDDPINNS